MNNVALGLAGEFRIMSELLLRGFNPAKSYMDNGCDMILENGLKIQVKTTAKKHFQNNRYRNKYYFIALGKGNKKKRIYAKDYYDYLIIWIINSANFLIIPAEKIGNLGCLILSETNKSKYSFFKDKWELLKR